MVSIYFILLFFVFANVNSSNTIRIYSNLAEIIRPLDKLPLEFTDDDWNDIRSDSITLMGEYVNITLQTITENKKSFNGTEIYIRSPVSTDKTTIKLIKAILIDEVQHIVKIQDESIADQQTLYFTVSDKEMFYLQEPNQSKYSVNFTYTNPLDSPIFVSYLKSNLQWHTQYQLNLYDNQSDLITMANIRNNGKASISIDKGELIAGDINLQVQQQPQYDRPLSRSRLGRESMIQPKSNAMQMGFTDSTESTVEQGTDLAGLYVFPITKPLTINSKTNYLLPMLRPHVSVQRYNSISKIFQTSSNNGKAQRSYRLKSDIYLSHGNCIIREQDRIVGEIDLPNLAAKNQFEFSIGEDANVIFNENVTLISSTTFNETESIINPSYDKHISPEIISLRTRSVYQIYVQIKNFKDHLVNIEYEQKGLSMYRSFKLIKLNKQRFIQDGSSIKSNITLKANTNEVYFYHVETIN